MICDTCRRHKKCNPYAQGTSNFKRTNILRHLRSCDHRSALQAEGCQSLTVISSKSLSQKNKAIVSAMRNVYWLAKEEIATLKYASLNQLVLLQGCADITHLTGGKNCQYTSYHIAEEMQEAISDFLLDNLKEKLTKAAFVGILIDESTDIATSKNLIICASGC